MEDTMIPEATQGQLAKIKCPHCSHAGKVVLNDDNNPNKLPYKCKGCGSKFTLDPGGLLRDTELEPIPAVRAVIYLLTHGEKTVVNDIARSLSGVDAKTDFRIANRVIASKVRDVNIIAARIRKPDGPKDVEKLFADLGMPITEQWIAYVLDVQGGRQVCTKADLTKREDVKKGVDNALARDGFKLTGSGEIVATDQTQAKPPPKRQYPSKVDTDPSGYSKTIPGN